MQSIRQTQGVCRLSLHKGGFLSMNYRMKGRTIMPKRRPNNVTQRKDGRWVARKVFGRRPDGKPNRKAFYGSTAAEAAQKLADYERQLENGLNANAANLTFGQWLDIWLREYKFQVLTPGTYDKYEEIIRLRLKPALGNYKLLSLRPEQLQAFINNLKKVNGEPMAVKSVIKIKAVMSGALGQAVKNGLIIRNPAEAVSMPKTDKYKKVGAFTPTEQLALLEQLRGHRLYALFIVALGTGMRIGEILALQWSNIDFIRNEITVSAAAYRSKNRTPTGEATGSSSNKIGKPKTRAGTRTIPLTLQVRQALIKHREEQAAERLKAGADWNDNNLVFCTALGSALEYSSVARLFTNKRNKAGISKLGFHSLRHSFATNAISAGMDYYYLSRIMGHASISITLDTYTDYMPDKSRSEMEKMEDALLWKLA